MVYLCGYELSNDDGQKWKFSSEKRSKFQILGYRSVIYLKRKLRTCAIKNQSEKIRFLAKKVIFFDFLIFSKRAHRRILILAILKTWDIGFSAHMHHSYGQFFFSSYLVTFVVCKVRPKKIIFSLHHNKKSDFWNIVFWFSQKSPWHHAVVINWIAF